MPYHDDAEATQWLQDYWDYVQMIEHGNEPSLDEIGGWDGLAQAFMDDDVFNQTVQYISDDVESDDINSDAGQLLSRLKQLKDRYMGMSKMKKSVRDRIDSEYGTNTYDTLRMAMFGDEDLSRWSEEELNDPDSFIEWAIEEGGIPKTMRSELMDVFNEEYSRFKASTKKSQDIHSMIADIRKNNNSLKKSRMDLGMKKGFDSYTSEGMNPIFSEDAGAIANIESRAQNILHGIDFIYMFEKDYENGKIKDWDDFYMVRESMKTEVEKWKGYAQFILEECDRILR